MLGFLKRNLFWMVLSVVLSIGLWLVVTVEQNPRESRWFTSVPVEVQNVPSNLTMRSTPEPIRVLVSAPQDVWQNGSLGQDKIKATADAAATSPGLVQLPVTVTVRDPRARVEIVDPQRVDVRLETIKQKDVPVILQINGTPASGFEVKSSQTTPKTVTVGGPQSLVDQVTFVQATVTLDGARTSISQPFPVSPMSATGQVTSDQLVLVPDRVQVDIEVLPAPTFKTVPVAPQLAGQVAIGYEVVGLATDPSAVTVTGPPDVLRDLTTAPTRPINVAGADSDLAVSAELDLPAGAALSRPQQILVRVLVDPIQGSKTIQVAPTIRLRGDQTVSITPGSIEVTVQGPMPVLATLGPSDIRATVDVTDLTTGQFEVKTSVIAPPLVSVESVSPETVTASIR